MYEMTKSTSNCALPVSKKAIYLIPVLNIHIIGKSVQASFKLD